MTLGQIDLYLQSIITQELMSNSLKHWQISQIKIPTVVLIASALILITCGYLLTSRKASSSYNIKKTLFQNVNKVANTHHKTASNPPTTEEATTRTTMLTKTVVEEEENVKHSKYNICNGR